MKWVYILKCVDNYLYVGETRRLYRRFWEHSNGLGGLNTSIYPFEEIIAIYKVDNIYRFLKYNEYVNNILNNQSTEAYNDKQLKQFNDDIEYEIDGDNLYAENNITECLMIHNSNNWHKIRGGKYTRFNINYNFPTNILINDLPLCKCGIPCDIKKNEEHNYLYFRCAKKNMWEDFKEIFEINEEPCNFFKEYIKDKELKDEAAIKFQERTNILKELCTKSPWLKHIDIHTTDYNSLCVGGCNTYSKYYKMKYCGQTINLCFDCFINKNEELANKYNVHIIQYSNDTCLF